MDMYFQENDLNGEQFRLLLKVKKKMYCEIQ